MVRDALRTMGQEFGLEDDDIKAAQMGASGVDIVFSPAARKLFPWVVEVKVVEALNVMSEFRDHSTQYAHLPHLTPLLFHMKNRTPMLVTMKAEDFYTLYGKILATTHPKISTTES
jgi:hypothetical protein